MHRIKNFIIKNLKAGIKLFSIISTLLVPTLAWATITITPSPTYTGNFTVKWSTGYQSAWTFQQKFNSGSWSTLSDPTAGTKEKSFSNKSVGTWTYRIRQYSGGEWIFIEFPKSVVVQNPSKPSNPTGPANSNTGTYTINWGTSTGAVRYQVRQRVSGGSWTTFNNDASKSKVFTNTSSNVWQYRARGCAKTNYTRCGSWSNIKNVNVAITPGVPASITTPTIDDDGSFTVTWGTATGEISAYVTYQEKSGDGNWINIYNSTGISTNVSGLTDGSYKYKVHACNTVSTYTSCSGYRISDETIVTNIPGTPGSITGPASDTDGSYTLSWGASTGTVDDYNLERRKDAGSWGLVQQSTSAVRTYNETLSQTSESGTYDYRVQACNNSGCSSFTPAHSTNVQIPLPSPAKPTWNLAPSSSDFGDYDISWHAATGTVDYYKLKERINGGKWSLVPSTTALSYDARGKTEGDYEYKVKACNVDACSSWSTKHNVKVHNLQGIAPAVSIVVADGPGTIAYNTRVSDTGSAVITVPLRVYPGVNGMAPGLSVSYSSGRPRQQIDEELPEDILGYGWSLSGLSAIRRCVKDHAFADTVQLDTSDSLCLDGEPLVAVSGNYLQTGAEYRTLRESFYKIEQYGTAEAPWFIVTSPNGTVSEYGATTDSQVRVIDADNTSEYFLWSVNSRTDSFGNTVTYTYHKDELNGVNYPLNIVYSGATIGFSYATRDDAAPMPLSTIEQEQLVLLHTIQISLNNTLVREYRMASETAPEGWKRLSQVQECGYDETGSITTCLPPLVFDWMTAGTLIPEDFKTGVERVTDGLGAITEFEHSIITETGTHSFLYLERPFGPEITVPDTSGITPGADGALKCVVTELRRSDGIGGLHRTTFAYHGKGLMSTRNWGFLGFYSQRIKDDVSGIVAYRQFRQDYPHFGRTSAVHQYDAVYGSHSEKLGQVETRYAMQSSSLGTDYPYISESTRFIFEKDTVSEVQLGASQQSNVYSFGLNGAVNNLITTTRTAESVNVRSVGGAFWGDVASYTLNDVKRGIVIDTNFLNRTTGGLWLIGFASSVQQDAYRGDMIPANQDRSQVVDMTPYMNTNAAQSAVRFPGDTDYELTTTNVFDAFGHTTSSMISGVNVSPRASSASGFLERRFPGTLTNALGKDTTVAYDMRFGAAKQVTDPNGRTSQVVYDALGRELQRVTPDNVTISTAYDFCDATLCGTVNGIVPAYRVQTTSAISPTRSQYMDTLGRVVRTEIASFTGTGVIRQDTYYDGQGRVDRQSQPYFPAGAEYFSVLTYDLRNRVVNTTYADGSSTTVNYDVNGFANEVIVTVDKSIRNADGTTVGVQTTASNFNILGDLIRTTQAVGTPDAIDTSWTYDGSGLPLTTTVDGAHTTTYKYDNAGNRTQITGPNTGTVTNQYTALGQVLSQTDNKLQQTTFVYDLLGRITSRTDAEGTLNWTYDPTNAFGALHTSTDNTGFTETHTFNTNTQLISTQTDITAGGYSRSYVQSYQYDTVGRVDKITYPSGIQVRHSYNTQGYLASLTDTADGTVLQTFTDADAFGNVTDENYGNGTASQHIYNTRTGRLESITTALGVTTIQDNAYAWRSDGSLESRFNNRGTIKQESFHYDALNRLEEAKTYLNGTLSRTLSAAYDRLGNITSKTSSVTGDVDVTAYQYGASPNAGPHAVSSASIGGVTTTLSYDLNGNVTLYDAASGNDKFISWNARNLPTVITLGTSAATMTPTARDEFQYGPDGQRYYKKSTYESAWGQRVEHTFYVGSFEEIIPETGPDLTRVKKTTVTGNVLHVRTDDLIGNVVDSIEYLHRDHLGSVETITDKDGVQLQVLAYDPYGERRNSDWSMSISPLERDDLLENLNIRTSRGYTGHEHLDRTGIIHMNGRIYDPQLGRLLSPDPIVQAPANSQSWNRYTYVFNNPLSFFDPSGFSGVSNPGSEITINGVVLNNTSECIKNCPGVFDGLANSFALGSGSKDELGTLIAADTHTESANLLLFFMMNGRPIPEMMVAGFSVTETAMAGGFGTGGSADSVITGTNDGLLDKINRSLFSVEELNNTSYRANENTWGSYFPGTKAGNFAAQYWADIATNSNHSAAPLANIPGVFAALWTDETALNTAITLGTAGISAVSYFSKLGYFRYVGPNSNPTSKWLIVSTSSNAPYSMSAAKSALQLPYLPLTYKSVSVPWWKPVIGPRTVWRNPQWGSGGGKEWYQGWRFPD